MNIVDKIERNFFLKELFPFGLREDICIGNIEFYSREDILVFIHTAQKPAKEVKKWGVWGENYNRIAIEVLISGITKSEIVNWQNVKPCQLHFSYEYEHDVFSILAKGNDWHVLFEADGMIFQRCSVYMNSEDDDEAL